MDFPQKRRPQSGLLFLLPIVLLVVWTAVPFGLSSCTDTARGPKSPLTYTDTVTLYRDSVIIRDSIILREPARPAREASFILVDKGKLTLSLYDVKGMVIMSFPCCCALRYGNKTQRYDSRTPEGVFPVSMIQDSRLWKHDSHDGRGQRLGCYGAHFIRLDYPPYHKIGIHGTDEPESLGTRASEGCIRVRNDNLEKLVPYVHVGMPVIIVPGEEDIKVNKAEGR